MAPTLVRAPFHRDGWVYEEKVDGWRILAYKDGGRVHLVSRNGRDHTRRFNHICGGSRQAVGALPGARRLGCDLRPAVAVAVRLAARQTRSPSPHRQCSWCSTYCTATAVS
jgi:hypothetical protein